LQEFNLEIKDKKGVENVVADHLSRIPNAPVEMIAINENFPDEHIFVMCKEPWYADIANYLATGQTPSSWSNRDKHRFLTQIQFFFWDEPYLFKYFLDQIIRRCLPEDEHHNVYILSRVCMYWTL